VDSKKGSHVEDVAAFNTQLKGFFFLLLMDRAFLFKDPVVAESAERLRFFRPESHLAAAFGADGDEIKHAGEPRDGRFPRFML
jgi:hypothetical protein